MIKIYTKVGDKGLTKQVTGKMVPKYDLQIEALGDVDELQSYLGVVIANLSKNCLQLKDELQDVQRNLYQLQADIVVKHHQEITHETVQQLEHRIDQLTPKFLPFLNLFCQVVKPLVPIFSMPGQSLDAPNGHWSN